MIAEYLERGKQANLLSEEIALVDKALGEAQSTRAAGVRLPGASNPADVDPTVWLLGERRIGPTWHPSCL